MPKKLKITIAFLAAMMVVSSFAAPMTQEDVFKSIQENVSDSGGGSGKTLLAIVLGFIGLVLILTLYNSREKRQATPQAVNHHGKLLKEISKKFSIRRSELKQLRLLADAEQEAGIPIESPLVFLICPSTLANAMRADRVKVDRKVVAGLARKLGIIATQK